MRVASVADARISPGKQIGDQRTQPKRSRVGLIPGSGEGWGMVSCQALMSAIGEGGEPGPEPSQLPVAMPLAVAYASFT